MRRWTALEQLHARDRCVNRPKFTTDLHRRIRLEIPNIQMGRSPRQKDHNHRFVALGTWAVCFRPQQGREAQSPHRQPAHLEERTTGDAIAKTLFLSEK